MLDAFEQAIDRKVISEDEITEDILIGFLGGWGREFYNITDSRDEKIVLRKGSQVIPESFRREGVEVVPFRRGQSTWSIDWK